MFSCSRDEQRAARRRVSQSRYSRNVTQLKRPLRTALRRRRRPGRRCSRIRRCAAARRAGVVDGANAGRTFDAVMLRKRDPVSAWSSRDRQIDERHVDDDDVVRASPAARRRARQRRRGVRRCEYDDAAPRSPRTAIQAGTTLAGPRAPRARAQPAVTRAGSRATRTSAAVRARRRTSGCAGTTAHREPQGYRDRRGLARRFSVCCISPSRRRAGSRARRAGREEPLSVAERSDFGLHQVRAEVEEQQQRRRAGRTSTISIAGTKPMKMYERISLRRTRHSSRRLARRNSWTRKYAAPAAIASAGDGIDDADERRDARRRPAARRAPAA